MDYKNLYKEIPEYVTGLFEHVSHPSLVFHNLEHTKNVVRHTEEISGHYKLSDSEMLILFAAAWFHDCGHLYTSPEKHESKSCEIMKGFLNKLIDDKSILTKIEACIMATKFPTSPANLLEQIICDADTYHLGTGEFKITNKKVFEEVQLRHNIMSKKKFDELTIQLLTKHHFYTDYCKNLLDEEKLKNLEELRKSK